MATLLKERRTKQKQLAARTSSKKHQAKKIRSKALRQVTITIDVTFVTGNGPNVVCDITGDPTYVTNNAIFLPLASDTDYILNFTFHPGTSGLSWNSSAFGADVGQCPHRPPPPPGTQQGQFIAGAPIGNVLQVIAAGQPCRSVAHYKLNFNAGNSCDPIIINN